ncbi:hypothetical protein PR003_g24672 [Phytophthora rubi]|uniref:Uncharacterized protein n=1 Tax=Phytophthora rubi TaxID=129364 RepID=A0A6A4CKT9_9STRA|nr:hypothetical protein PR003_g24672 [Phytophthora rubi]
MGSSRCARGTRCRLAFCGCVLFHRLQGQVGASFGQVAGERLPRVLAGHGGDVGGGRREGWASGLDGKA